MCATVSLIELCSVVETDTVLLDMLASAESGDGRPVGEKQSNERVRCFPVSSV